MYYTYSHTHISHSLLHLFGVFFLAHFFFLVYPFFYFLSLDRTPLAGRAFERQTIRQLLSREHLGGEERNGRAPALTDKQDCGMKSREMQLRTPRRPCNGLSDRSSTDVCTLVDRSYRAPKEIADSAKLF